MGKNVLDNRIREKLAVSGWGIHGPACNGDQKSPKNVLNESEGVLWVGVAFITRILPSLNML